MRKLGVLVALVTAGSLPAAAPAVAGGQTQPTPEVTAFCDAADNADKATAKLEEGGKPKQSDIRAADTALSRAESSAPPEVASQVQAVAAAFRTPVQSGKDPTDVDASFEQNFNAIQQYRYGNCGYNQLQVTGTEYEFQGLPKTLPPGKTAVQFTDGGTELHELMLLRLKGRESAKKVAAMHEEDVEKKAVGETEARPGQTSYLFVDLGKPGRYLAVCHFRVGSTSEQAAEQAEKKHGKTHAQEGMYREVTVKAGAATSST